MVDRIDNVHGVLATLSMRIDALVTALNSFRTLVSDRLADYSDTVARLARTQAVDIAEYQRSSDRLVGEVRRSVNETEDTTRRLDGRVGELSSDVETLTDLVRSSMTQAREAVAASEKLGRQVGEGLDQFGERVLSQFDTLSEAAEAGAHSMRTEVTKVRRELAEFHKATAELAAPLGSLTALDEVRAEIRALRQGIGNQFRADLGQLRADVTQLRHELGSQSPSGVSPGLEEVRDAIVQLKRRMAVRARGAAMLADDQIDVISAAVAGRLGESVVTIALDGGQFEALVEAVVDRLEHRLELVDEPASAANLEP
jgi:methyl-accepting chemotaxis protein